MLIAPVSPGGVPRAKKAKAEIPVGRVARPEEVAGLVAFLAGDGAAMSSVSDYVMGGGFTAV